MAWTRALRSAIRCSAAGSWGGLRGRNSITMTTMTPIAIIVPMASVRAAACAKSVLARICKSDMSRFYRDSPGKRTNGER